MGGTSVLSGSSVVYSRRRPVSHVRTYNWPPIQLNFWIFVMLLASCSIVGVFAQFMQIQHQLRLPIPWYFPYYVVVGSLSIVGVLGLFMLIFQRRLLPSIVMIGAFMLFVLWLVGLVEVSIQLFGPGGSVQSNCNLHVFNQNLRGPTEQTLAWLQQKSICQSWYLVFSMGLIGCVFQVWIMIMAYQVFVDS